MDCIAYFSLYTKSWKVQLWQLRNTFFYQIPKIYLQGLSNVLIGFIQIWIDKTNELIK